MVLEERTEYKNGNPGMSLGKYRRLDSEYKKER